MNIIDNLWPSFEVEKIKLPKTILDEQARIFNNNMQGLLECRISTREQPVDMWAPLSMSRDAETMEKAQQVLMHIVAPKVGGYRLAVLVVTYLVSSVYPCKMENCLEDDPAVEANDPDDFAIKLKAILNSKKLINAVNVLRSQSE